MSLKMSYCTYRHNTLRIYKRNKNENAHFFKLTLILIIQLLTKDTIRLILLSKYQI